MINFEPFFHAILPDSLIIDSASILSVAYGKW